MNFRVGNAVLAKWSDGRKYAAKIVAKINESKFY